MTEKFDKAALIISPYFNEISLCNKFPVKKESVKLYSTGPRSDLFATAGSVDPSYVGCSTLDDCSPDTEAHRCRSSEQDTNPLNVTNVPR